jgi:hypothetical protein
MPLARYFVFVGGTLLLLLFVADFSLPKSPTRERPNEESYLIRIHSDQKWPERLVFDTTAPAVTSAHPVTTETDKPAPAVVADGPASARDAFAQLQQSKTSDVQPSDAAATRPKPRRQHIAKRRTPPPAHLAWRQPQFGWFDQRIW